MNVVIFQHRITCAFHQAAAVATAAKTNAKSLKKKKILTRKAQE